MRAETVGKTCELCGTSEDLQVHHTSYIPEITQILCASCHQKQHPNHGVGKSDNSPMFGEFKKAFIDLHSTMPNRRSAAAELGISYITACAWDRKTGFIKYTGRLCSDSIVGLDIPILKSVRDRLKELQEEHGHDNAGETIGWLIDEMEKCCGKPKKRD